MKTELCRGGSPVKETSPFAPRSSKMYAGVIKTPRMFVNVALKRAAPALPSAMVVITTHIFTVVGRQPRMRIPSTKSEFIS